MENIFKKTIRGTVEIARGMFTVLKHVFRSAITIQYPEEKQKFSPRLRGRIALTTKEDGSLNCLACMACTKVCPCGDLIQIKISKDENNKTIIDNFTIDIGRCIFCGNCTEACPKNALIMIDEYELADYSRESLVYDMNKLKLSPEESTKWKSLKEKDI